MRVQSRFALGSLGENTQPHKKGRKTSAVSAVSTTSIPSGVTLLLFAISKNTVEAAGAAS